MRSDIVLAGVGGQGTVLASKLLSAAALAKGLPVRSAETIGMAQKGGSVFSFVRIGAGAVSPLFRKGAADLLVAFEPAEAVRMLPFLKAGGAAVVSTTPIQPVTAALGGGAYTGAEAVAFLRARVPRLTLVDGAAACRALGSPKVLNMVLLGAAQRAGALPFGADELVRAMRAAVKPAFHALNEQALRFAPPVP